MDKHKFLDWRPLSEDEAAELVVAAVRKMDVIAIYTLANNAYRKGLDAAACPFPPAQVEQRGKWLWMHEMCKRAEHDPGGPVNDSAYAPLVGVEIIRETERAVLVYDGRPAAWIPKVEVFRPEQLEIPSARATVWVRNEFAYKNGLVLKAVPA